MDMNEDFATEVVSEMETVAENAEPTAEEIVTQATEPVKTYTEEELEQIVGKRLARNTAKIRREYENKYGALESVLRAGTGMENVSEMTDSFRDYYQGKGIQMPTAPTYSDRDIEVLAKAEADEVIGSGFEEVAEEVDRLANLGQNMTAREKALFKKLATYRQSVERGQELAKIGVPAEVYNSDAFKDFAGKFSPNVPITEVYDMYTKTNKSTNIEKIGSMKNGNNMEEKTYYTPEEVDRLTAKDYDNPEIMKRVRESMKQWK